MAINIGDAVRVSTDPGFTVGDDGATPIDPGTVQLVWYAKGQPPTTWTYPTNIARDSEGVFHADIPVTRNVRHYFRWVGSGGVSAAEESYFDVEGNFAG